jgi:AbrB family looped-hinge helix DNA binding protein
MNEVTVSSKFQIVIPRQVREALKLKPGQKLSVFAEDGRIGLRPIRSIKELRGIYKGLIVNDFEREPDREF